MFHLKTRPGAIPCRVLFLLKKQLFPSLSLINNYPYYTISLNQNQSNIQFILIIWDVVHNKIYHNDSSSQMHLVKPCFQKNLQLQH